MWWREKELRLLVSTGSDGIVFFFYLFKWVLSPIISLSLNSQNIYLCHRTQIMAYFCLY